MQLHPFFLQKNPRLMVPYLVMMLIAIVLLTLSAAFIVVVLMLLSVRIGMVLAIIFGGVIFIMTYFNLVVRAYYKEVCRRFAIRSETKFPWFQLPFMIVCVIIKWNVILFFMLTLLKYKHIEEFIHYMVILR